MMNTTQDTKERLQVSKTLRNMGDDRWKTKGHAHTSMKAPEPVACPHCMGRGTIIMNQFGEPEEVICYLCKGTGEIS